MKSNLTKVVSLVLSLVMMVTLFASCGSKPAADQAKSAEVQASASTQAQASTAEVKSEAPAEIKALMFEVYPGATYDNEVMNTIQQKTNTKLSFITIGADQKLDDKLNVILAAGDRPDIIQFNADATETKLTEANLLLPINTVLDKMPNINKYWGDLFPAMKHTDGNIYAIPVSQNLVQFGPVYRQDWLTKLGMKVPTTIDEYYDVAVAMATKDPDGNGKKDTYAFGGIKGLEDIRLTDHIFGAYGLLPNLWTVVDGKLVDNSVLPAAKEALKFLNKLYKAGAIDPEFLTDDWNRNKDKLMKGMYGAATAQAYLFEPSTGYYTDFHKNVPNGEWALGAPLTGASQNPVGMRKLNQRGWLKTGIYKDTKVLDGVLRLLDYVGSDEGITLLQAGFKDKTYKDNGDGTITKNFDDNQAAQLGIYQCTLAQRDLMSAKSAGYMKVIETLYSTSVANQTDALTIPEAAKYQKTIDDYTVEQFTKMIAGEVSVESGFDNYVKEWEARGGKELTDAFNKAYAAMGGK